MATEVKCYKHGICFRYGDATLTQIFRGEKTIDTRVYKLPDVMIGEKLLIIQTPGKTGNFKARGVGEIIFSECKVYKDSKSFYDDAELHCIYKNSGSCWCWNSNGDKPKFGWVIESVQLLDNFYTLNQRPGIRFTKDIIIN